MTDRALKLDPVDVGARLERLRVALDLGKGEFAQTIGLDPSSYSKIIQGEKPLKADIAFEIAERWGVTMDFLYRGRLHDLPDSLAAKLRTR